MTAPCFNCADRAEHCHNGCNNYKAYAEERKYINNEKGANQVFTDYFFKSKDRCEGKVLNMFQRKAVRA